MPPKLDPETGTRRVYMVAAERWIDRVNDWRYQQRHPPTFSEAIRQLVDLALDSEERKLERKLARKKGDGG